MLAPRSNRAYPVAPPPIVHVLVKFWRPIVVQHGAHATPKVRVDEFAGTFPAKVRIIQLVVSIQTMKILGQLFRRFELVHVDVRTVWRASSIVRWMGTHYNWQNVVSRKIEIYYVPMVIIMKC